MTQTQQIEVRLNGDIQAIPSALTIAGLLRDRGILHPAVAVELNGVIIPAALREETTISPGDAIEIVTLAGGG